MVAISRSADFVKFCPYLNSYFLQVTIQILWYHSQSSHNDYYYFFLCPQSEDIFPFSLCLLLAFYVPIARHRIICCSCIPYFFSLRHDMADHALYTVPNSPLEPMYHALLEKKKNLLSFHTVCIMPTESNF